MKNLFNLSNKIIFLFIFWAAASCSEPIGNTYYILHGSDLNEVESNTISDFEEDLKSVVNGDIRLVSDEANIPNNSIVFVVGTPSSNKIIKDFASKNIIKLTLKNPGSRGGIWAKTNFKNNKTIVLGGSDIQGLQYAIYDYTKDILKIDPFKYWTGLTPKKIKSSTDLFNFDTKIIAPPIVPILCYFENDVDELANYRGQLLEYDWESYTEMIDALVRIRYNAIQLFDMLGRPEFFIRPEYKALKPDYDINIDYIEKMIDYAHAKGMMVQIDMALGYKINPISIEEANCWSTYKDKWIAGWKYYLEKTPIGKADIFALRPRHQVWDWKYESACGENKTEVFNEVTKELGEVISQHKPEAKKLLICYHDGMEMFNNGFNPPKDWIVAWSDDGYGNFEFLPESTRDYDFGTYMHAGFWLNHTVHKPYPEVVDSIMTYMFNTYNATKYCMVNGQNFRPFLLNIEAYSDICNNPEKFDGNTFYETWTQRYFNNESAAYAVSSMKNLSQAQQNRIGYVQHLWEIREAISYLSNAPIKRPGKTPVPYELARVENDLEHVKNTRKYLKLALIDAEKGYTLEKNNPNFYHAYILLPVQIYLELIKFESTLHQMALLKKAFEKEGDKTHIENALEELTNAKTQLKRIHQTREKGDIDNKWKDWYHPKIRRPNNGFPTQQMLDDVKINLESLM